ncbi:uncharacterized protein ISCGN_016532 [Ixodes scapularis]
MLIRFGSEGQIEEALQAAADTVEEEARRAGLECSQPKSELLVLRRSKKPEDKIPIDIKIQGQNIEEVENIRVLGLHISNTPSNIAALGRLESSVHQVARMIRRIANKRRGMEEHDLHKLLQAFVITKITYAFPYLRLKKAEEQKIDILIRHAYKTALGLPKFTANEKLLALGVHNTFSELKEAHLTTQTARLSSTPTGRMILDRLGIEGEPMADHPGPVPGYIRKKIRIKPLPKNMNPQNQQGRREARARAMHRHLQRLQDVIYVDAANYQDSRHRFAICGVPHPRDSDAATPLIAATVFTKNAETAEEAAIAAAIAFTEATTVLQWVSFDASNDTIRRAFEGHGEVKEVSYDQWKVPGFVGVESTTRIVRLVLRQRGHIRRDCRAPRCMECHAFGHEEAGRDRSYTGPQEGTRPTTRTSGSLTRRRRKSSHVFRVGNRGARPRGHVWHRINEVERPSAEVADPNATSVAPASHGENPATENPVAEMNIEAS